MRSRVTATVVAAFLAASAAGCAHSGAVSGTAAAVGRGSSSPSRAAPAMPTVTAGPGPGPSTTARSAGCQLRTGSFAVRQLTMHLVDTSRPTIGRAGLISLNRALTTQLWVPVGPGRWPLVVFAPGFRVGVAPYRALLEAWASHGYVVAAVEFPLTDAAVAGPNLDENDIVNQPADLRFVTDALIGPTSPVAQRIDPFCVAVAGHSDGAETALAASIQPAPPGQPAYRAVIVISARPLGGVTTTSNPPLLVIQGDADSINSPSRGYRTWQNAAPPKDLEVLHGAGHLQSLEPGSQWLPVIERVSDAFLDTYLLGDGSPTAITQAGDDPPLAAIFSS